VAATLANDELRITRAFAAPRDLVFELWSKPEHLKRWMGPEGFDCPVAEVDFRVGGRYRGLIRSEEYGDSWYSGVYREIEPHERLVFTFTWNNTGPSAGRETLVTITFEEAAGRTLMTFHQAPFADLGARDRHVGGWTSAFDKIAAYLERLHKETAR
jgi:uncharacterized protein YndB with AHSA1/START domain